MNKIIIKFAALLLISAGLHAQSPTLQTAKDELLKINKVFDSTRYLGFDVNIRYNSDTSFGRFDFEELGGKYILNNRKVYYKMGNMEYVQNDSFSYSLYHDEKMMMMTKDVISSNSNLFPLKEFVDSILTWYNTLYGIVIRDEGDSRVIEFSATDSLAPYKRFAVYYEPESHYPDRFEFSFMDKREAPAEETSVMDAYVNVKQYIVMSFTNYYYPVNTDVFNDTNYIFFDRLHRQFRPSEKYKSYKFIANGTGLEENDDTIEMYPPPVNNQQ